jgi:hypothetical protein
LENQPVAIAIAAAAAIATAMHMATSSRIRLLLGSGASSAASGTGKFNDAPAGLAPSVELGFEGVDRPQASVLFIYFRSSRGGVEVWRVPVTGGLKYK